MRICCWGSGDLTLRENIEDLHCEDMILGIWRFNLERKILKTYTMRIWF